MIHVGIAGIGFMGWIHWLAYQKSRGVKVTAVCSRNKKKRAGDWRDIQGNFGPPGEQVDLDKVAVYGDFDSLVADPKIDVVDITLPPALHADLAIRALQAGKHVFCEKPIALAAQDSKKMMRAAEKAGKQLLVGHVLPFFPEYAWALKTVKSGKYGKLLGGNFHRVISNPSWLPDYYSAEKVGGPMLDLHVHDAHFIPLLFGRPLSVTTQGRMRGDVAEYWNSQFGFDGPNYSVRVTSGTLDQQGRAFTHGFEIHLEKATLLFDFAVIGGEAKYLCPPTIVDNRGKANEVKLAGGDPVDAFVAEIKEVAKAIKSGKPSALLDASCAMDAIVLCQKQTESLLKGRTVKVS